MPTTLQTIQTPAQIRSNIATFNREATQNQDRARSVLRQTRYWVYDPSEDTFGPSKFVGFTHMTFERYDSAHLGDVEGAQFSGGVTHKAIVNVLGTEYAPDSSMRRRLIEWGANLFGDDAFGGAEFNKWLFATLPVSPTTVRGALALPLHAQFTRRDVYALFGINYHQAKTRHLNLGLSPRLRDGGYLLFITLDKESLRGGFDYDDHLFDDQLIWTTREGADENDPDYEALHQESTRISLFVRRAEKQGFTYLGEIRYKSHAQFNNPRSDKAQQRYILSLDVPVPAIVYTRLHSENDSKVVPSSRSTSRRNEAPQVRKPSTFSETKRAFQYALGDLERYVNPKHHNYQTRLRSYLQRQGVTAEFERDSSTFAGYKTVGLSLAKSR